MATLEELQAKRKNLEAEIKRRGGKDKAPGFAKQLAALDGEIRTAKGSAKGLMTPPPTTEDKFTGLSKDQSTILNQRETADIGLQHTANKQLDDISKAYEKPLDFSKAPALSEWKPLQDAPNAPTVDRPKPQQVDWSSATPLAKAPDLSSAPAMGTVYDPSQGPALKYSSMNGAPALPSVADYSKGPGIAGTGDFNDWRSQQIQATTGAFDARFSPIFKQQNEDLEQQLANRGIPIGSEVYQREKRALQQNQADQALQNYSTAYGQAGNAAAQFAGIQNTGHELYANDMNTQFGQGLALNQQGMANQGQMFGESLAGSQNYANQQAQQFGQQSLLHQQGVSDMSQQYGLNQDAHNTSMQDLATMNGVDWQGYNNSMNAAGTEFGWKNEEYNNNNATDLTNYQMGNEYRNDYIDDQMRQRNAPLNDFNAINGAVSSMGAQNLGYSQEFNLQNDQQKAAMKLAQMGGGSGGGGGGGSVPSWQTNGFSSYQDQQGYNDAREFAMWQQKLAAQAQYGQGNQGPSSNSILAGQAIGTAGSLLGAYWAS